MLFPEKVLPQNMHLPCVSNFPMLNSFYYILLYIVYLSIYQPAGLILKCSLSIKGFTSLMLSLYQKNDSEYLPAIKIKPDLLF